MARPLQRAGGSVWGHHQPLCPLRDGARWAHSTSGGCHGVSWVWRGGHTRGPGAGLEQPRHRPGHQRRVPAEPSPASHGHRALARRSCSQRPSRHRSVSIRAPPRPPGLLPPHPRSSHPPPARCGGEGTGLSPPRRSRCSRCSRCPRCHSRPPFPPPVPAGGAERPGPVPPPGAAFPGGFGRRPRCSGPGQRRERPGGAGPARSRPPVPPPRVPPSVSPGVAPHLMSPRCAPAGATLGPPLDGPCGHFWASPE